MSFWGCIVAPGQPTKIENRAGELLHLSQACLAPDTPSGSAAKVLVEQGGQSYAIACLREGGQEFCALDLFLDSSEAKLAVKGKATVHLTGYFEAEDMDEEMEEESKAKSAAKPVEKTPAAKAEGKASPKIEAKSAKGEAKAEAAKAKAKAKEEEDDEEGEYEELEDDEEYEDEDEYEEEEGGEEL
mmetsp:Transcript_105697/g.256765  ORF Transcript_105697/g.256765 Transcript_105697/m.256765 type:complete len:186 (-) Transcript_105697:270-827(-)